MIDVINLQKSFGKLEVLKGINLNVKEREVGIGFDALKEEYVDMVEAGILDPVKVTRTALQNANSIASVLLTTEAAVGEIPEEMPAMPANPGAGMM